MKPEYFLESFPKEEFPQYVWTEEPELPTEVWTTETSHRDGQQGGLPLTCKESIKIYDLLCNFTKESKAIRQAEFFVYQDSDKNALVACLERHQSGAAIEPTTWIRAKKEDVELIKSLGVRETGMLASASDYHTFHKFSPGGREQAAKTYLTAVERVLDAGIRPRLHLEDATRAPLDFILPFIEAVLKKAQAFDVSLQPKIRVCDTMGLGLPYEDVALPRSIPKIFQALRGLGLKASALEFHPHNDLWMVVPNCLAAIRAGCGVINGTCLGKGERTGNAPLEAVIVHLKGMGFFDKSPDFKVLNELAAFYNGMAKPLPANYPLYGKDAHRTRAGIHADGLNKFWWMYAPFNVPKLLGRPLEVSLTKDSGIAGLMFLLKQHLGLELDKNDPDVKTLHAYVARQFKEGRVTGIEWPELEPVAKRLLKPLL